MRVSYLKQFKLAIILSVVVSLPLAAYAAPVDNDDSYQLPAYVPDAAQPKNSKKIIFKDKPIDNDEIYATPQASSQPALKPDAQAEYQRKYADYQKQLAIYNQQMAEYKRNLAARQGGEPNNDSTYNLPGQYHAAPPTTTPVQPAQQYQQKYDYNDQKQDPYRESFPNTQGLPDSVYY